MGFSRQEYWSGVPLPSLTQAIWKISFCPIFPSSACYQLQSFQEAPWSCVKGMDCGGKVLGATWGHEFCPLGSSFPSGEMEEADPLRFPQPLLRGFRTRGLTAGPLTLSGYLPHRWLFEFSVVSRDLKGDTVLCVSKSQPHSDGRR